MRRHIHSARDFILPIIDFFYPPFRRLMNLQTFRYAASGGGNVLLGFLVYVISYKFIFAEKQFDFGFYAFKGHVAAMLVSFLVTFPVGFFMSKYVVFSDSNMKGKVQLVRYFVVCMFNLLLNYLLLKVFVETLKMNAILAQILTIAIVVVFSYLAQRNFSFKATPPGSEEDVTD
ncbi:MAG: GtrA family protein [Chitinophagaceae bacterium]|nr:GtrA family protein [Chitinophagaceae bacterium]